VGPTQHARVTITGTKTLTCSGSGRERGTELSYTWKRRSHHTRLEVVGHGARYKPSKSESGRLYCFVTASNDGGEILAGTDDVLIAR
jgi:hypothetical protein